MGFLDCPYCNKEATSYFNLGNTFYFFRADKKCNFCKNPIKFEIKSLITFYLVIGPLIVLITVGIILSIQVIAEKYFDSSSRQIFLFISVGLMLFIAVIMNLFAIKMANKLFKIKMFSGSK
jgi:uncharacterized membrane protein YidH (DUF202 family)